MKSLKNILLVSYIKNKGIRRLCFVIGIIPTLVVFLATIGTNDFISVFIEKFILLLILFYFPFLVAVTIKWIKVGFSEKENSKTKKDEKIITENTISIKENKQNIISDKKEDDFWIKKIIWHDKEEIEKSAKDYDKTPWYRSNRFIVPTLYFILQTISLIFITKERDIYTYIGALWFAFSFIYFSVKGYRFAILLLIALVIFDFIYGIIVYNIHNGGVIVARFMIYGGFLGELITAFRIECHLIKNNLSKKKKALKDILIGLVLPTIFVVLISSIMVIYEDNKPLSEDDNKSYQIIGKIYKHTTGIRDYCKNVNYNITTYPEIFKQKFADKILFAEQEMKRLNIKSQSIYEIEGIDNISYEAWQDERKLTIARFLIQKQQIQHKEFEWNDEYYQLLSQLQFCQFIDENAEELINEHNDLDILRN